MKTKLSNTGTYLLLIDEECEIKQSHFVWHYTRDNLGKVKSFSDLENSIYLAFITSNFKMVEECTLNCSLILAYYPLTKEAKELDLLLLPNPFEEVDIEKLAKEQCPEWNYSTKSHLAFLKYEREGFIKGYKAAQSKQFSLEDVEAAFEAGDAACIHRVVQQRADYMTFDKFRQSLSTQQLPKEFILGEGNTIEKQIKNGYYGY